MAFTKYPPQRLVSRRLSRIVDGWGDFWFRRVPPHSYALLRILLGIVGCIDMFGMRDLSLYWDPSGLATSPAALEGWLSLVSPELTGGLVGRALYACLTLAFIAMTIGLWTRTATAAAFVGSALRMTWAPLPMSSAHSLLHTLLFCMVWANSGAVWSLDARLSRRRPASLLTSICSLRLMQVQIALMYGTAGLWKLFEPVWWRGDALVLALSGNVFRRLPDKLPLAFVPAAEGLTYVTLIWELTFPILILFRRTRTMALVLGVILHVGMAVLMELGIFSAVAIVSYVAFLPPHTVAELTDQVFRLPRQTPEGSSAAAAG